MENIINSPFNPLPELLADFYVIDEQGLLRAKPQSELDKVLGEWAHSGVIYTPVYQDNIENPVSPVNAEAYFKLFAEDLNAGKYTAASLMVTPLYKPQYFHMLLSIFAELGNEEICKDIKLYAGAYFGDQRFPTTNPWWQHLFDDHFRDKGCHYHEDEADDFNRLPSRITVYRGLQTNGRGDCAQGWSWSTSKEVAERFKGEGERGVLLKGEIRKDDAHIFLSEFDEQEFVISSDLVSNVEVVK